ncbi:MAG: DUF4258 domain-containing protein [Chloroflexi bacterium]|nr:DUF4258 domain-containing protein [Chloroflexota bacterium]
MQTFTGRYNGGVLTNHAVWRMAQRNVSEADICFVLEHGHKMYRAGAIFFFLRRCDFPKGTHRQYGRLEGTTVVISRETHQILTVYRNRKNGLRHIKQKPRRRHRRRYHFH